MDKKKLTPAQEKALRNLAALRPSSWGLSGRSAMGGHTRVMVSLYKLGMVDHWNCITDKGRAAVGVPPNVEVTGAARLYRAASGGPQGYA